MSRRQYVKKIIAQKVLGLVILVLSVVVVLIASNGISVGDKDATIVLFLIPTGIYLLLTKHIVLH